MKTAQLLVTALWIQTAAGAETITANHPALDGIWQVTKATSLRGGRVIDGVPESIAPVDGGKIPFQPWNETLHTAWINAIRSNVEWPSNNQHCLVAGTVRAMKGDFPWRLIESPEQVTVLFEEDNRVNIFRFANEHSKNIKPTWAGDAIARWDGDTLIVDVVGFNGKTPFPHAIYHTSKLHLVHHFHLLPGGRQLQDDITIEDPGAFTRTFQAVTVFDRYPQNYKLAEYRCAENNQDLPEPVSFWPVEWGPE